MLPPNRLREMIPIIELDSFVSLPAPLKIHPRLTDARIDAKQSEEDGNAK